MDESVSRAEINLTLFTRLSAQKLKMKIWDSSCSSNNDTGKTFKEG
jgi:hypothetical protein